MKKLKLKDSLPVFQAIHADYDPFTIPWFLSLPKKEQEHILLLRSRLKAFAQQNPQLRLSTPPLSPEQFLKMLLDDERK